MKIRYLILLLSISELTIGQTLDSTSVKDDLLLIARDTQTVNTLNKKAIALYLSNPEKTKEYGSRALLLADSLKYQKGLADSYYTMSLITKLKADNGEELNLHLKSLRIYQSLGDSGRTARTYNAIGVVYQNKNDFKAAGEFYSKALELYKSGRNEAGMASTLRRIGNMELDLKHFELGLQAYGLALEAERRINHPEGIANILNNIGVAYYEQGKYDEALPYYQQSLEIIQRINNLNRLSAAYHNIGRVYFAQGRYDEALGLALKALPIAQKLKMRNATIEATLLLSEVYSRKGDFQKAHHFLFMHNQVKDSVQNEDNVIQFAHLQALYKMEEKEKEIELIKKDHELAQFRQRLIIGALFLVLLAGAWAIYFLRNRVKIKQEIIRKNQELHDAQLGLTKAELENKRLDEIQLQRDLEFRHKELLTYTLNLVQKNTIMQNLRDGVHELLSSTDSDTKLKMTKLVKAIDYSLESEKDWDEFRMYFQKVHSSFFDNLKTHFPDLSQTDLKLQALISLNLSMKEMAELMGISAESVKMARHRLRKKLDMATEENLTEFIASFKKD